VSAGLGVREGDIGDAINRKLVVEASVVAENTAVAVAGVLAKADVGDDVEVRESLSQKTNALDDRALRIVGGSAKGVFCSGSQRDTEENYGAEALVNEWLEEGDELVDTATALAWE